MRTDMAFAIGPRPNWQFRIITRGPVGFVAQADIQQAVASDMN